MDDDDDGMARGIESGRDGCPPGDRSSALNTYWRNPDA